VNQTRPRCRESCSDYTYEMGALLVCPECAHERSAAAPSATDDAPKAIQDAVGPMQLKSGVVKKI
jgi:protein PhnA